MHRRRRSWPWACANGELGVLERGTHRAGMRDHPRWTSSGTSCSSADSEPCWPGSPEITGSATVRTTAGRTARGHDDVADPVDHVRAERAEPALGHGLLARHHPAGVAEHRPPGREHLGRRSVPGVDVPERARPRRARRRRGAGRDGCRRRTSGRRSPCRGRRSPAAARPTAAPSAMSAASASICRSCIRQGAWRGRAGGRACRGRRGSRRRAAAPAGQRGDHLRGEVAERVHAAEHAAPQRRPGEAGPAEGGGGHRRHADARRGGLLQRASGSAAPVLRDEDVRAGRGPWGRALRQCRASSTSSTEPHRGADEPVRARRQPGAERGQADDRAGRKARPSTARRRSRPAKNGASAAWARRSSWPSPSMSRSTTARARGRTSAPGDGCPAGTGVGVAGPGVSGMTGCRLGGSGEGGRRVGGRREPAERGNGGRRSGGGGSRRARRWRRAAPRRTSGGRTRARRESTSSSLPPAPVGA